MRLVYFYIYLSVEKNILGSKSMKINFYCVLDNYKIKIIKIIDNLFYKLVRKYWFYINDN